MKQVHRGVFQLAVVIALTALPLGIAAQQLGCRSDTDCNDNNPCTEDTCAHAAEVSYCTYKVPNPAPHECLGCCQICTNHPNAPTSDCCENTDAYSCFLQELEFTPGGFCGMNGTCSPAIPGVDCPASPVAANSCKQMTKPNRHRLSINNWNGKYDRKDRLEWGWRAGEATALADFGNPTTSTGYGLCLYDGSGTLIFGSPIPPGAFWQKLKSSFIFTDRSLNEAGIRKVILRSRGSTPGRASIRVVGAGRIQTLGNPTPSGNFPDLVSIPVVTAPQPVRMQLINSDGNCWEGHYQARIRKNQVVNSRVSRFRAKND